jgi:hypothetical protein
MTTPNKTTPNKYCADLQGGLWFQYHTEKKQWFAKPCCMYKTDYPVTNDINQEFWQHPELQKQRQDNLAGQELSADCVICKNTENSKNYSRRQSWNERLDTHWQNPTSVIELDIQADFSCNLACRICSPQFSTLWRKVETKEKYNQSKKFKVRADNNNVFELLNTMPMHDIRQIHFQGGEPLLSYTHMQILEKLNDTMDTSQIVIWYHSNATVRVPDQVLKFWEKFKSVEIYFSLDDMGSRMEYQRWPADWQEMHDNLMWYKNNLPHNTLLNVERTVSTLNLAWIMELEQWHRQNFSQTVCGDPISISYHDCVGNYSLLALTQEYKDAVLQRIPPDHWVYKRIINAPVDNEIAIADMFVHLNTHDSIRNQDWRGVYPEFNTWYQRYL